MAMKEKKHSKNTGKVLVTFAMPAMDGCNCLYLVGNFNEWPESVYRMQRADDGMWSLTLELESGREYQYRYRTDNGIWLNDRVANRYIPSLDDVDNSVVRL